MSSPAFTIGGLAERSGRRASAIRYYEQIGLLPPAQRVNGRRIYGDATVRRLALIDVAQRGGLALDEIRLLLEGRRRLRDVAAERLPAAEAALGRARDVHEWLEHASTCECATVDACPLFV